MDERIIGSLNQVAREGNINGFYDLIIGNNVNLLEDIDKLPFVDTPLHMSASARHFQFSLEMMILKPSFVSKRNLDGYTPICLALQNGHTGMVCQLLQHNANLVRVKGRECMTPLHYAAKNDNRALLEKILSVCPNSIIDMTTQNETALHIALKNDKLEAFKFLVGWLRRKWFHWRKILEQKDVEGNTVLHIAVSKMQTPESSLIPLEALRHLVECGVTFFNVNTALDILKVQEEQIQGSNNLDEQERQRQVADIRSMRKLVGELTASCLVKIINQVRKPISDEKRNALLVVAALLVTVTYQAILSPPGGLWQDHLFEANTTDVLLRSPDELFKLNITAPHRAGSATARGTFPFSIFMAFNSILFLSSIATMAVLIPPGDGVGAILAGVSVSLYFGYFSSLMIITQAPDWLARIVLFPPITIMAVGYAFFISRKDRFYS